MLDFINNDYVLRKVDLVDEGPYWFVPVVPMESLLALF